MDVPDAPKSVPKSEQYYGEPPILQAYGRIYTFTLACHHNCSVIVGSRISRSWCHSNLPTSRFNTLKLDYLCESCLLYGDLQFGRIGGKHDMMRLATTPSRISKIPGDMVVRAAKDIVKSFSLPHTALDAPAYEVSDEDFALAKQILKILDNALLSRRIEQSVRARTDGLPVHYDSTGVVTEYSVPFPIIEQARKVWGPDELDPLGMVNRHFRQLVLSNAVFKEDRKRCLLDFVPHCKLEKDDVCAICRLPYVEGSRHCKDPVLLPCGHKFGLSCIQGWANVYYEKEVDGNPAPLLTCPYCRATFRNGCYYWPNAVYAPHERPFRSPPWVRVLGPDRLRLLALEYE
jgi:hypothetical protein